MTLEAALSLSAAWSAHSPALGAFGGDSVIELLSAAIVLWRFRAQPREGSERLTSRVAGMLLFGLAACVVAASTLSLLGYNQPKSSFLGVAVLLAAAVIMPWLAREKRHLSAITNSAALRADAAESAVCAYLAVIALVGLAVEAIWKLRWADPVAALIITPLIVHEGREALQGRACGCC
jgi:divalent metal cation (Fe/Co/Zn/Cd) transporter